MKCSKIYLIFTFFTKLKKFDFQKPQQLFCDFLVTIASPKFDQVQLFQTSYVQNSRLMSMRYLLLSVIVLNLCSLCIALRCTYPCVSSCVSLCVAFYHQLIVSEYNQLLSLLTLKRISNFLKKKKLFFVRSCLKLTTI